MGKSQAFACFTVLQLLDILTTICFLRHGVAEGNPLMRLVLGAAQYPVFALALPKIAAIGLALYAVRTGRTRMLARINVLFTCCIVWNLAAIAAI